MITVHETNVLPEFRKAGKDFFHGTKKVVLLEPADPEAMKALEDAGRFPIDVEALRSDVVRGNQARNLLKFFGKEIPTNKDYFQRSRDQQD
ncbi:MAG: hypothetical protein Q8O14_05860 [bacterium]|nr:hypothetical protein [bacterium]